MLGVQLGSNEHLGQQIQPAAQVLRQQMQCENRRLGCRVGVHRAAQGLELASQGVGVPGGGALEDHVLQQVGDAVACWILVA